MVRRRFTGGGIMNKCKCRNCKGTKWEITIGHGYSFMFTCLNCGDIFEMISLVDLELRCKDV